jgi:hypothetical protein
MTVEGGEKRGRARKRARNARFLEDARLGDWAIWGLEVVRRGWEGCARVAMCRDGVAGRQERNSWDGKRQGHPPMNPSTSLRAGSDSRGFGGCAAGTARGEESKRRGNGRSRREDPSTALRTGPAPAVAPCGANAGYRSRPSGKPTPLAWGMRGVAAERTEGRRG